MASVASLSLNALQNTTFNSRAPEGYEPSVEFISRNSDGMKTDYAENVYCFTTLPQPLTAEIENDGFTECFCTGWFKRRVVSTPGFPARVPRPRKVVYEMRKVAGRGLGLVATEDIAAGDLIIAERPLLVAMIWSLVRPQFDRLTQEQMLRGAFADMENNMEEICARMSPPILKAYKSLWNSHATDGSGPLTGIHRTNGFDVEVEDPQGAKAGGLGNGRYSCVSAIASRLNHSCSPNVMHRFNMPSFCTEIYAVRSIAKGEEMLVTYCGVNSDAATRQASLKPYGFVCDCAACKDPVKSDKERKRVLEALLPKTSQGIEHADATLAAFEATGLQSHPRYLDLLRRVAQIHGKKGSKERADMLVARADRLASVLKASKDIDEDVLKAMGVKLEKTTFKTPEEVLKHIQSQPGPHVSLQAMQDLMRRMPFKA